MYYVIEHPNGIEVKLKEGENTVGNCIISTSNGIWNINEWFIYKEYRNKGYGEELLKETLKAVLEEYGMPQEMRYNWDGINEYVLQFLKKHFYPQPIGNVNIYKLDKEKVLLYIK